MSPMQQMNDYMANKWGSLITYLSSFFSALAGFITVNNVAIVLGMLIALVTYLGDRALKKRREEREIKLTEQQARINRLREERERLELAKAEQKSVN